MQTEGSLRVFHIDSFADWRTIARDLLQAQTAPNSVHFTTDRSDQLSLFPSESNGGTLSPNSKLVGSTIRVPRELLELLSDVSAHRESLRWNLMYRVLWRVTNENPHLLQIESDEDILRLKRMQKSVTRDEHKMKAFVRFRKAVLDETEHFIAFHRPDHLIVRKVAPFFAERFSSMNWTILTPDESVTWNQQELLFGPGVASPETSLKDDLESAWLTYYRSIFNPARIKLRAMVKEMPTRHWPTLPETAIIQDMLDEAPQRVETMIKNSEGFNSSARNFIPPDAKSIEQLREAALACQGCPLHAPATQTVFGVGNAKAKLMLVGEQPGDNEDLEGMPFVGPAGKILTQAFEEAGIDRNGVYLTNAVKHFKFQQRGKMRLHAKPGAREVSACKPWLLEELRLVKPERLVCLGATAAQAIIGRDFSITRQRGQPMATEYCEFTLATYHPSAILRVPDKEQSKQMFDHLVNDLRTAIDKKL